MLFVITSREKEGNMSLLEPVKLSHVFREQNQKGAKHADPGNTTFLELFLCL